tara:strand:+ start:536 stop:664 length:129 start_codon:yes stop_codon:yes gene_type:complete
VVFLQVLVEAVRQEGHLVVVAEQVLQVVTLQELQQEELVEMV